MKQRDLYYYLGRDKKHGYPATPIGNMIVIDTSYKYSQISAFVHNLIIRLIQEYNPRDLDISMVTLQNGVHADFGIWKNALTGQRIIPQIKSITEFDDAGRDVSRLTSYYKELIYSENKDNKRHVIIMDWAERFIDALSEDEWSDWIHILSDCSKNGYYFVFIMNGTEYSEELLGLFDIRASLSTSKEISMQLFGSSIASPTFSKGQIFVKTNDSIDTYYIPFFPDTWIEKFCRYYGIVNEEWNNG